MNLAQKLQAIHDRWKTEDIDFESDHINGDDAIVTALRAFAADHNDPNVKDNAWLLIERWENASESWWWA